MIQSFYWGTVICSGLIAFSRKIQKNRTLNKFFLLATIISITLIVSSNREGNDIINYVRQYNAVLTFDREPLYQVLELIGQNLGWTFYQFRAVVSLIGYCLIVSTLKRYIKDMEFVLFFYCFHLLFMDSMQLRNFLATSIFVFSIRYLIDLTNRKNLIAYIICVLLEISIHTAFVFSFILLCTLITNRKKMTKILFLISVLLIGITYLNGNSIPFIQKISSFLLGDNARAENYFANRTQLGFVIPMVLYFVGVIGVIISKKYINKSNLSEIEIKYLDVVLMINFCYAAVIPLMMMDLTFYRLVRNLLYFNLGVYSNAYFMQKRINKRVLILLFVVLLVVGWRIFDTTIYSSYDFIIGPVLEGDWFWK